MEVASEPSPTDPRGEPGGLPGPAIEILLSSGLSALWFVTFVAVPLVGAIGLPLAAVPAVRTAHRRGTAAALFVSVLSSAIVLGAAWALAGARAAGGALVALVVTGLPALAAGLVRRGADPSRAYVAICGAGALVVAVLLVAGGSGPASPLAREISGAYDAMIPAAVDSYSRSGMNAEAIARVRATLNAAREFTLAYLPGLLATFWVLGAALAFYAGARSARPAASAEETRYERLRLPAAAVVLFVATGAGFALLQGPARRVAGNLILPLSALFFVAGLSIICHFARKWFRVGILRAGLYALVAYFPINVIVALLGLFDWYADFRHRGEKA